MTCSPNGWLGVPKIEDTPPRGPPRVPMEDTLPEVPEEGQQEEDDTVENALGASDTATATEVLGGLGGSGSHSGSELNAAFGCS